MMGKDTFMTNIHLDSFFREKVDSIMNYTSPKIIHCRPYPAIVRPGARRRARRRARARVSVPGDCAAGSHFPESLANQSGAFRYEKISVRGWKTDCGTDAVAGRDSAVAAGVRRLV